ncbi:MAG: DnaD domain protein [Oscillospiraceae bacterium]|nr:DnaD domain protein [Oscillospiraceae bacterium]
MSETVKDKCIPARTLDKLIHAHDGDVALLYLYQLQSGDADPEGAATALCRTLGQIADAQEKLTRLGLSADDGSLPAPVRTEPIPPAPAEELPQYRAADIARRGKADPHFSAILDEAANIIGRALNGNDLRILFGIYDYLALPAEVILELMNFVGEQYRERYQDSRRPSARALEKEAYVWVNKEILTLEQAEEYIRAQKERSGEIGRLQAILGLQNRDMTASVTRYLSAWLDMGFGEDAVAIALDRTITNIGTMKLSYMNSILQNWHEKGLHDPREIQEKDGPRRPAPGKQGPHKSAPIDLKKLKRTLDDI